MKEKLNYESKYFCMKMVELVLPSSLSEDCHLLLGTHTKDEENYSAELSSFHKDFVSEWERDFLSLLDENCEIIQWIVLNTKRERNGDFKVKMKDFLMSSKELYFYNFLKSQQLKVFNELFTFLRSFTMLNCEMIWL